ncbi:MAG: diguanylate cyclase [Leptospiraceae bacterium]|nr:diguanylate cyclase [Leptospiraceae bacterium]
MTNYHKEEYSLITFTKELLDRILQSIDIPIVLFDQNARIIYVNERFYRYVKTTPESLLNQKIDINSSRLKEELFFFSLNVKIIHPETKQELEIPLNISPFEYNNQILYLGTIHDGYYDSLTGLPNVPIFEFNVEKAIASAKRRNKILAILFIDVDNFKFINDTYGHLIGDKIIQMVSKILESTLRIDDFITRKGGDEFIILLNDLARKEDINYVLDKIIEHFEKPIEIENQKIPLTLSIGISIFPDDGDTVKDLIQKADYVMYKSKKNNRNSYTFYSQEIENDLKFKHKIEKKLLQDYKNNFKDFEIVFQPIFGNLQQNKFSIEALEVLLRWKLEANNYIDTNLILDIAKNKAIIFDIEKYVLLKVAEFYKNNLYLKVPMHLNISSRMFYDISFIPYLTNLIEEYNLSPKMFVLEIQESTINKNLASSAEILQHLKELKFSICIDEFASGTTNLSLLYRIKPDYLKINFNVKEDELKVLLEIIDSLYFVFKTKIIANKIEDQNIFKKLMDSKRISYFQGFHFSKVLNTKEIITYLDKGWLYEF